MKNQNGFTLIELVITVAVLGIIIATAWPEFERHQTKKRRVDGINALTEAAHTLQQCHSDEGGYTYKADDTPCDYNTNSDRGYYVLSSVSISTDAFEIRATPTRADAECTTLTLTHLGKKGFTGTGNLNRCWSQ